MICYDGNLTSNPDIFSLHISSKIRNKMNVNTCSVCTFLITFLDAQQGFPRSGCHISQNVEHRQLANVITLINFVGRSLVKLFQEINAFLISQFRS